MRDVWDLANKNNVAIYAVDPRGLPVSEFDLSQPAVSLAGGSPVPQRHDGHPARAGRADRRPRHRQSQRSRRRDEADRPRHERVLPARVQLDPGAVGRQVPRDQGAGEAAGHPGARAERVLGADGQDVARALAPRAEPPKAVDNALASISVPAAAHNTIRTWIGTSRGANGKTKVTLVWEPMPRVAGDRDARSEAPARVMVTAVGPDGAPYFRGRVPEGRLPRRRRRSGCGRRRA